jgi:predicted aldo/keto reductase-like oxidoreductase
MMHKESYSRRSFIKNTVGAGIALAGAGLFESCSLYDPKGLPTTILGKTGVRIPRIGLGLGSRFCEITDEEESSNLLEYALDNGLYYWDTACVYENTKNKVISEERVGKVLKKRRSEVFISTKVSSRNPDEAMRQIETSLKRLQTGHLDMLKIHSVRSVEDVDLIFQKGNLYDILNRMKREGITRFIGFSGHGDAQAIKAMIERGNFDSMLFAMNHWRGEEQQQRQEMAIPLAQNKGMGIMIMKAIRPKETIEGINTPDLVRFALSIKGPNGVVVGMESKKVIDTNLHILRNFQPMDDPEMKRMAMTLSPFFNHEKLEWMSEGYCDGNWV